MALLGAISVLVARALDPWIAVGLFAAGATFVVLRYRFDASERGDPGYTTEIASLCTYAVGALAQLGEPVVATVITIVMVALLRSKRALHRAGELLSPVDMEVLIRFLVITGIVLPLLPDEAIDPWYGVLRPRDVWRMVVLISGLSFVGYVLMRMRAGHSGHVLTGILSGLVSSTAATLAYARAGRGLESTRHYEALIVLAASTSFARTALMLGIVAPTLLAGVAAPLAAMAAIGLALGLLRHRPALEVGSEHRFENPLTLRLALSFAALYALVLLALAAARTHLANEGVYVISAVAALPGTDAPSLSLARLALDGHLAAEAAVTGIVIVTVAATLGKVGVLLALGRGAFGARVAVTLLAIAATGGAFLFAAL